MDPDIMPRISASRNNSFKRRDSERHVTINTVIPTQISRARSDTSSSEDRYSSPDPDQARVRRYISSRDAIRSTHSRRFRHGSRGATNIREFEHRDQLSSSDSDDDAGDSAYAFTLSRHSQKGPSAEVPLLHLSSKKEAAKTQLSTITNGISMSTQHIVASRYVGEGVHIGLHAAELSVLGSPTQGDSAIPIVLRWVHFEDSSMNLDDLQNSILGLKSLSEAEKQATSRLLRRIRKGYDKPLQSTRSTKSKFMTPCFLQESIVDQSQSDNTQSNIISWWCMPLFSLERFTSDHIKTRPASHPARTLLQARFGVVRKARDLQQAVCSIPGTSKEHCLHIAQIWSLVVRDTLLITCARDSISALQGDSVIVSCNPRPYPSATKLPSILVSNAKSQSWALCAGDCPTWYAFLSHFWEFWPRTVQFLYHGRPITSADWPKILAFALNNLVRINLMLGSRKNDANKTNLIAADINDDHDEISMEPSEGKDFHVFDWLNNLESIPNEDKEMSRAAKAASIEIDLQEVDIFLKQKTNLQHRALYRSCVKKERKEVYSRFLERRQAAALSMSQDSEENKSFEELIDTINSFEVLFSFFLSPQLKMPTVEEYWGGVYTILHLDKEKLNWSDRTQVELTIDQIIKTTVRQIKVFRSIFSQVSAAEASQVCLPSELQKAWLHLVLAMASVGRNWENLETQLEVVMTLIRDGMRLTLRNLGRRSLLKASIFQPQHLATLINSDKAERGQGSALDIADIYSEYMRNMEGKMEANPLDRGHQNLLQQFKQEILIVKEILHQQQVLFIAAQTRKGQPQEFTQYNRSQSHNTARQGLSFVTQDSRGHYPTQQTAPEYRTYDTTPLYNHYEDSPAAIAQGSPLSVTNPYAMQDLLTSDAILLAQSRLQRFNELDIRATELEQWNLQMIDSNKDRQAAAIYMFTIVTVIFLPISTVASVLGMNTNDVRNMEITQWIFWTTAIPLTLLITGSCIAWNKGVRLQIPQARSKGSAKFDLVNQQSWPLAPAGLVLRP